MQNGDPAVFPNRFLWRGDHIAVIARSLFHVLADSFAIYGQSMAMDEIAEFANDRGQSTGVVEVFHEVLACGHEVQQAGNVAPERVPIFEREFYSDAPGNRDQMDYCVR